MTKQFADFYDVDSILEPVTGLRMSPLVTVLVCRHIWADFMSLCRIQFQAFPNGLLGQLGFRVMPRRVKQIVISLWGAPDKPCGEGRMR